MQVQLLKNLISPFTGVFFTMKMNLSQSCFCERRDNLFQTFSFISTTEAIVKRSFYIKLNKTFVDFKQVRFLVGT